MYDLKFYPAAVKLKEDLERVMVVDEPVSLYANYQYSDEFLLEKDVYFDQDDISWGMAFVEKGGELIKILDDETS